MVFASVALPLLAQSASEEIAAHARAAREAEQRNDFPTAVREYESVVGALPRSAEMQSNLGVALYFDHQLTRAIPVFRKAMALNANLLAPHLFSGLAWYRLSKPDAAVQELGQATRLNSSDAIAHTWLGYAYIAQSRFEPAFKQFQAACQLDPNNIDVWYSLGQTYLQIGKEATVRLLDVAPDGGRTWELAGEQSQLQGNRHQAIDNFEGAFARRPDIPELAKMITALGGTLPTTRVTSSKGSGQEDELYRQAHDAQQQARAAFERVAQISPDSYRAHQILADSLTAQQKHDEAIAEYRTVLKLQPDLPGIHEAIGNNLLSQANPSEALKEFGAELELQPRSASARTNVGQVLLMLGRDEAAGKMLTGALQMDRPPAEGYRLLGKLALRREDYPSAVSALTRYISLRKDDATAYYLLSKAYRGAGDKDRMKLALGLFEKTSQDAKARSRAQRQLQPADEQKQDPEETAPLRSSAAH